MNMLYVLTYERNFSLEMVRAQIEMAKRLTTENEPFFRKIRDNAFDPAELTVMDAVFEEAPRFLDSLEAQLVDEQKRWQASRPVPGLASSCSGPAPEPEKEQKRDVASLLQNLGDDGRNLHAHKRKGRDETQAPPIIQ